MNPVPQSPSQKWQMANGKVESQKTGGPSPARLREFI
jgi:hypothetical protein